MPFSLPHTPRTTHSAHTHPHAPIPHLLSPSATLLPGRGEKVAAGVDYDRRKGAAGFVEEGKGDRMPPTHDYGRQDGVILGGKHEGTNAKAVDGGEWGGREKRREKGVNRQTRREQNRQGLRSKSSASELSQDSARGERGSVTKEERETKTESGKDDPVSSSRHPIPCLYSTPIPVQRSNVHSPPPPKAGGHKERRLMMLNLHSQQERRHDRGDPHDGDTPSQRLVRPVPRDVHLLEVVRLAEVATSDLEHRAGEMVVRSYVGVSSDEGGMVLVLEGAISYDARTRKVQSEWVWKSGSRQTECGGKGFGSEQEEELIMRVVEWELDQMPQEEGAAQEGETAQEGEVAQGRRRWAWRPPPSPPVKSTTAHDGAGDKSDKTRPALEEDGGIRC
ncbi:hypothetical protein BDK51DRAFT_28336 [Blyttiomyces helicus]|uniref:Uncharacterized protein n=1 Tax=Blyttiomyces helicus TaxID=388810 RepID=A0A4V1ISQ5_9FUNG|nr:hypothetical protein BDK51DRAFT_28336 [Blyttiomyces helicus]|eukprot:RKO94377.1 hypothetical protein BDK51DRAFT_28336 [Blyttiomyces helicus]